MKELILVFLHKLHILIPLQEDESLEETSDDKSLPCFKIHVVAYHRRVAQYKETCHVEEKETWPRPSGHAVALQLMQSPPL